MAKVTTHFGISFLGLFVLASAILVGCGDGTAPTGGGAPPPPPVASDPRPFSFPLDVAITPDGAFAYVANFGSGTVSVIATASNTVVATVIVGLGPVGVGITPDGAFAYVTNEGGKTVSVIATASNTVVATVPVGDAPQDAAITPDGAFAYVPNFFAAGTAIGTVSVIATASNTVVATIPGA